MNINLFPSLYEVQRPYAVSQEAAVIRNGADCFTNTFAAPSQYCEDMYEDQVEMKFVELRDKWINETMFLSDSDKIFSNSNYLEIIELGEDVLQFILRDLIDNESHWYSALQHITDHNPVAGEHQGIIPEMNNDWISWAKENLLIDDIDNSTISE